jgi:prepilin-type N-terminal cleavage/methylation domain-containing protein
MIVHRSGIKSPLKSGFTLVELSIVLVIIGLIIGGVLVGRDLISAATVRAQISQIEKYQTAVNTFRGKYGYLPGDIPGPTAQQFGFTVAAGTGTWCPGGSRDGNGIIAGTSPANGCPIEGAVQNGEPLVFWVDLSTAGLIGGGFNTATPDPLSSTITTTTTPGLSSFYPAAKIGNGNYVVVASGGYGANFNTTGDGFNYFVVSGISSLSLSQDWSTIIPVMEIASAQAYGIDSKIDDGYPMSGKVITMGPYGGHFCLAGMS